MKQKCVTCRALRMASVLAGMLLSASLPAASGTWTGATDSVWATTTDWTATPVPGTGDTATLNGPGNGNTTISLGTGVTIKSVIFDTASAAAYTIGSGAVGSQTLTLDPSATIQMNSTVVTDQTINAALKLGSTAVAGTYTIVNSTSTQSGAHTLTLAGAITGGTGGTAGAKTLTLAPSQVSTFPAAPIVIAGAIGGGGGALGVTQSDSGNATLSGTNTFTGPLQITAGTLSVPVFNNASADGPLGHSTTAVSLGLATLIYTGATTTSTKPIAATSFFSTLSVGNAVTDLTLNGVVSGSSFIKDGPGTLTFAAANSETSLEVNNGTLRLSGAGTIGGSGCMLTVNGKFDLNSKSSTSSSFYGTSSGRIVNNGTGTSTLTVNTQDIFFMNGVLIFNSSNNYFSGTIADNDSGTGVVAMVKTGPGFAEFDGANTYTGTTLISGGVLTLAGSGNLGSGAAAVTVSSGATLFLSGASLGNRPVTIAGPGFSVGAFATFTYGALEASGTSTYAGVLTLNAAATVYVDGSLSLTNTGTITGPGVVFTLGGPGTGSIASVIGTGIAVTKSDGGTWTLSGTNTFPGVLTIAAGTLAVPVFNNSVAAGPLGNSGNPVTLGAASSVTGTLAYTGGTASSTKRFTLAAGGTGAFRIDNAAASLTLSGLVSGSGNLAKIGPGTLILGAANNYTGSTTVSAGTLTINQAVLPNAADVNLTSGATLNLTFSGSDVINRLFIDGVLQSAGTWGSPTSSATFKTSLISGSGILNVTSGAAQQPYWSWIAGHNVTGPDSAFNADPNHDGVPNGLAWILGGDPLINSTSVLPQASTNATYLFLTFNQIDASESNTTLTAQWSTDLASWNNVSIGPVSSGPDANGVTVTVTENGTAPDTVVVAIPRTLASSGKLFARLSATMP